MLEIDKIKRQKSAENRENPNYSIIIGYYYYLLLRMNYFATHYRYTLFCERKPSRTLPNLCAVHLNGFGIYCPLHSLGLGSSSLILPSLSLNRLFTIDIFYAFSGFFLFSDVTCFETFLLERDRWVHWINVTRVL